MNWSSTPSPLIPAKAGIQGRRPHRLWFWIPACAGMSGRVRTLLTMRDEDLRGNERKVGSA
jgi:hypothetical protein